MKAVHQSDHKEQSSLQAIKPWLSNKRTDGEAKLRTSHERLSGKKCTAAGFYSSFASMLTDVSASLVPYSSPK
jgi:hypothetical protein